MMNYVCVLVLLYVVIVLLYEWTGAVQPNWFKPDAHPSRDIMYTAVVFCSVLFIIS